MGEREKNRIRLSRAAKRLPEKEKMEDIKLGLVSCLFIVMSITLYNVNL